MISDSAESLGFKHFQMKSIHFRIFPAISGYIHVKVPFPLVGKEISTDVTHQGGRKRERERMRKREQGILTVLNNDKVLALDYKTKYQAEYVCRGE